MTFSADTTAMSGMPIWFQGAEANLYKMMGRELVENMIRQRADLYKVVIEKTESDFYGESKHKHFTEAVTVCGRAQITDEDVFDQAGIRRLSKGDMIFHVYDDHLSDLGTTIKVGDFLKFQNKYYEIFDDSPNRDSNERRLGIDRKFYKTYYSHVVEGDIFAAK